MPSVQYYNQSAPFWDFVASFEDKAFKEPGSTEDEAPQEGETENPRAAHWGPGGRHGPCGGGRRGRGGFRGHRGGPPFGMHPFAQHPFAQFLSSQFNPDGEDVDAKDYQPPVDVFSTTSSYHVHVSLPGVKKEDVGLNYNSDKSELSIAGVIYRPGDEDFLKTLSMGERKVGAFERKVKLGNERHPAEVDADGITAKLEDGVLRVEIPKTEKEYVEIKKVDIE